MFKWFPGHMHKGRKAIDDIKGKIDVVIDVRDARAPLSTYNPLFDEYLGAKPRVVILNKMDRADPAVTPLWEAYFKAQGHACLTINAVQKNSASTIVRLATSIAKRVYRPGRPITAMIVGVPNVGKSTLINTLAGRKIAQAGNLPALTRAPQRVSINVEFELFDMPGILDPSPQDEAQQYRLALIAAMRDTVIEYDELGIFLLEFCQAHYPKALKQRYSLKDPQASVESIVEQLALHYGKQNENSVGALLVQDFRDGHLGRLSLERPPV
jgi:ribosome biogenesis GTPase A